MLLQRVILLCMDPVCGRGSICKGFSTPQVMSKSQTPPSKVAAVGTSTLQPKNRGFIATWPSPQNPGGALPPVLGTALTVGIPQQ